VSVARQIAQARLAFARAAKGSAKADRRLALREFAEDADFCGLTVSPVAGAILDAADGEPVRISDEDCRRLFRCEPHELPVDPCSVIVVGAGRGGGKTSQIMAPAALHAAWFTPLYRLGEDPPTEYPNAQRLAPGERPKVVLIAATTDLARQAFELVLGLIDRSPLLRAALASDPTTKEAILRRPDGIEVRIQIVAAKAQGASVRSGTILFLGMDEACFFRSEDGYEVTDRATYEAAVPRLAAGGRVVIVSTPWVEGEGLLEGFIETDWGTHKTALVAARIPSYVLNPAFDITGEKEAQIRRGPSGEETWKRENLAIPLPKGSKSFFSAVQLRASETQHAPAGEQPEAEGAGADLAHTSDSAAQAVARRYRGGIFTIPEVREIASTDSQLPSATYEAFGIMLERRKIRSVAADGHYKATFKEALAKRKIHLDQAGAKDVMYAGAKDVVAAGRLALGDLAPAQRAKLVEQLLSIIAKPNAGGTITIIEPRGLHDEGGTSHADLARAVVVALWRVGSCEPKLWEVKPLRHREAPRPPSARPRGEGYDRSDWGGGYDRSDWG